MARKQFPLKHDYFKFTSLFLLTTTLLVLSFYVQSSSAAQAEICQIKPLDDLELPLEAGELIYAVDGNLMSLSQPLASGMVNLDRAALSPNGVFFAVPSSGGVAVYNSAGERIYWGTVSRASIYQLYWLGNEKVYAPYQLLVYRDPVAIMGSFYDRGHYLIDPFSLSYITVPAPNRNVSDQYMDYNYFLQTGYLSTADGRYLYNSRGVAFDSETQQRLTLDNFHDGTPTANSHRLVWLEQVATTDTYGVHFYDFDTDTQTQVATFVPETEPYLEKKSWSPDENLLAYGLGYREGEQLRRIEILRVDSNEIISTCLGLFYGDPYSDSLRSPDFAWSLDSRYLVLSGVLEGEDMDESYGVYLYDTETNDIYQVYSGRADIIGWMTDSVE